MNIYYCTSCRETIPPKQVYASGKALVHGRYDGGCAFECGKVIRLALPDDTYETMVATGEAVER